MLPRPLYKTNEFTSLSATQTAVVEHIQRTLKHLSAKPFHLFISGGSVLPIVNRVFSASIPSFQAQRGTISFIDDRFDSKESNYLQFSQQYPETFERIRDAGLEWIDTSPHAASVEALAAWYEEVLMRRIAYIKKEQGWIGGLLGMGPDAHIAGILPFPDTEQQAFYDLFLDTSRFVVGYDATNKNVHRLRCTGTFRLFEEIDHLVVYIEGQQKHTVLTSIAQAFPPLHTHPALYYAVREGTTEVFSSQETS